MVTLPELGETYSPLALSTSTLLAKALASRMVSKRFVVCFPVGLAVAYRVTRCTAGGLVLLNGCHFSFPSVDYAVNGAY